jgi:hypothetical protein
MERVATAAAGVPWAIVVDWGGRGLAALASILMGFLIWQGQVVLHRLETHDKAIRENQVELIKIQTNRYTPADAYRDKTEMTAALAKLSSERPLWVTEALTTIKEDLRTIKSDLRELQNGKNGVNNNH